MPEFNVDNNYFEHVKTKLLRQKLGIESEIVPLKIWAFAAKNYEKSGLFKNLSPAQILSVCELSNWPSLQKFDPQFIIDALVEFNFLDKTEQGYKVHDWEVYQGHLHTMKIRAQKGAQARWGKIAGHPKKVADKFTHCLVCKDTHVVKKGGIEFECTNCKAVQP